MPGIEIVKPAVDIGIATNRLAASQTFWAGDATTGTGIGLRYDHLLKVGGGVHQHRYDLGGAVLKLNSHQAPLGPTMTGYVALTIDAAVTSPPATACGASGEPVVGMQRTPDGTPVQVTAFGDDGSHTVVHMQATNPAHTLDVLGRAFDAQVDSELARIGETIIDVIPAPQRPPTTGRTGTGIRYLTVQVADVESAHAHALASGMGEAMAPIQLGDIAKISFVLLPDGDWVELSQRASLTSPLA